MKVPELNSSGGSVARRPVAVFGGMNRTPGVTDGEFADTCNFTSDAYPALVSREQYGLYKAYDSDRALRQVPLIAWNEGLVELIADESASGYDHLYYNGVEVEQYNDLHLSKYGFNQPPILIGEPAEHREAICFNRMVIFLPYMTYFDLEAYDPQDPTATCCGKLYNVRNIGTGAKLYPLFEDGGYILAVSVVGQDFPQAATAELPTASGLDRRTIAGRWDDANMEGAAYYQLRDGAWVLQNNFRFRIDYTSSSWPSIDKGFHVGDIVDVTHMTVDVSGQDVELGLGTQFVIDELGEGYIVISSGAFDEIAFAGLMQKCIAAVPGTTKNKCVTLTNLQIERKVPTLAYGCVSNNRIFGCDTTGHEIYACYQGDPFVWYNYSDGDLSAYAATVGTPGEWSGCAAYDDRVLFMKHDRIHVLAGSYPSAYSLSEVETPGARAGYGIFYDSRAHINGCTDGNPVAVYGGAVYYGSTGGIYRWSGGQATKISDKLGEGTYGFFDAFAAGGKIYFVLSLPGESGVSTVCFDPRRGIWHRVSHLASTSHASREGGALVVCGNSIYVVGVPYGNKAPGEVDWNAETGPLAGSEPDHRYVSRIQITADCDAESEIRVDLMYDESGIWKRHATLFPKERRVRLIPVIPRRCQSVRMRISGRGKVKIFLVSYYFEKSTELGRI